MISTREQIDEVIQWMKTWEELKHSAIPIRFYEDFSKRVESMEKPPEGVPPKWLWDELRRAQLLEALNRYTAVGKRMPEEWVTEYNALCIKK